MNIKLKHEFIKLISEMYQFNLNLWTLVWLKISWAYRTKKTNMQYEVSQSFLLSERNSMSFESVSHDIDRDGDSSNTWHQQLVKLSLEREGNDSRKALEVLLIPDLMAAEYFPQKNTIRYNKCEFERFEVLDLWPLKFLTQASIWTWYRISEIYEVEISIANELSLLGVWMCDFSCRKKQPLTGKGGCCGSFSTQWLI